MLAEQCSHLSVEQLSLSHFLGWSSSLSVVRNIVYAPPAIITLSNATAIFRQTLLSFIDHFITFIMAHMSYGCIDQIAVSLFNKTTYHGDSSQLERPSAVGVISTTSSFASFSTFFHTFTSAAYQDLSADVWPSNLPKAMFARAKSP